MRAVYEGGCGVTSPISNDNVNNFDGTTCTNDVTQLYRRWALMPFHEPDFRIIHRQIRHFLICPAADKMSPKTAAGARFTTEMIPCCTVDILHRSKLSSKSKN